MPSAIRQFVFAAIGTTWRIDFFEPVSPAFIEEVMTEVHTRITIFDRVYSRFRDDSLVTAMSRAAGTYEFPPDATALFTLYRELYEITDGLVTPLIGQVLIEAGYDAQYSLIPKELHEPPRWEEAIEFIAPHTLIMKKPIMLDVGAMGKGYLIDLVSDVLWQRGLRAFCIDAGGDILYRTPTQEPLEIALEHPGDAESAVGVVTLLNTSVYGSAGNRRTWADFHHIINPKTLRSPREISAVWTIAKTTLLADAMSTALFFVPGDQLRAKYSFEYLILYPDMSVQGTPNFPARLFTS